MRRRRLTASVKFTVRFKNVIRAASMSLKRLRADIALTGNSTAILSTVLLVVVFVSVHMTFGTLRLSIVCLWQSLSVASKCFRLM